MRLIARIAAIRPFGDSKAIDVLWRASTGEALRDDGATEIPDQVDVALDATDEQIRAAIDAKRAQLMEAYAAPGFGITRDADHVIADYNQGLVGEEV